MLWGVGIGDRDDELDKIQNPKSKIQNSMIYCFIGRVIVKILPLPNSESTLIVP